MDLVQVYSSLTTFKLASRNLSCASSGIGSSWCFRVQGQEFCGMMIERAIFAGGNRHAKWVSLTWQKLPILHWAGRTSVSVQVGKHRSDWNPYPDDILNWSSYYYSIILFSAHRWSRNTWTMISASGSLPHNCATTSLSTFPKSVTEPKLWMCVCYSSSIWCSHLSITLLLQVSPHIVASVIETVNLTAAQGSFQIDTWQRRHYSWTSIMIVVWIWVPVMIETDESYVRNSLLTLLLFC
jgi:hypothetical protein